ncbi:MAG: hypothetical protein J5858_05765 [Lentisphaeria bacterium]|nr:hypothetical protein [Lentisphaeria bacterium]
MKSIEDKIFARIIRHGRGSVITNRDFWDIATPASVDWCLYRLKDKKIIRPIIRGIYDYPKFSELLQEELAPDLEAVAQAIARKNQWHIQISGSAALNLLGLSTQIPLKTVYYSDGPTRNFMIGDRKLQFKHLLLRETKIGSPKSEMIVQALSELGEDNITPEIIDKLKRQITPKEREKLFSETLFIRDWIRKKIISICKEQE